MERDLDFFSEYYPSTYKRYPDTSILECQGHLGDYLGVQPEPVDAQVEHGEGADGGERDGDRLVPDVGHGHHVHQVANAGYQIVIVNNNIMITW